MKRLLSIILTLALTLSLATALVACGDGDNWGTTPSTEGGGDENRYEGDGFSFDASGLTLVTDSAMMKVWVNASTGDGVTLIVSSGELAEEEEISEMPTAEQFRNWYNETDTITSEISDVTVTGNKYCYTVKYVRDGHQYCTAICITSLPAADGRYTSTMITFVESDASRPVAGTFLQN